MGEMIRPYRCSNCDKSYKDPATLRQHEKTHWLTRPYPCSICGKKFTRREHMKRHTLVSRLQSRWAPPEGDRSPGTGGRCCMM